MDGNNMNNMNNMQGYNKCCEQPEMMPKMGCGCGRDCPTIYKECPPIVTCSKQVLNQYHITKQPYIHNYHTETPNKFIFNAKNAALVGLVTALLTAILALIFK